MDTVEGEPPHGCATATKCNSHLFIYLFIYLFSLSARLFKKYNPEKSESDADDFELCELMFTFYL